MRVQLQEFTEKGAFFRGGLKSEQIREKAQGVSFLDGLPSLAPQQGLDSLQAISFLADLGTFFMNLSRLWVKPGIPGNSLARVELDSTILVFCGQYIFPPQTLGAVFIIREFPHLKTCHTPLFWP